MVPKDAAPAIEEAMLREANNDNEVFSVGGNGALTIGGGTAIKEHLSTTFNPSFLALKPSTRQEGGRQRFVKPVPWKPPASLSGSADRVQLPCQGDPDAAFPTLAVGALVLTLYLQDLSEHARAEIWPEHILKYFRV
jgi:hypothetical protein